MVKEVDLQMFATVLGVSGNQEQQYIDTIKNMLDTSHTDQSYGAVKAAWNCLLLHEKNTGNEQ